MSEPKDKVDAAIAAASAVSTHLFNFSLSQDGTRVVQIVVPLDVTGDELNSVVSVLLREGVQSIATERAKQANGGILVPNRQLVRPT